jgi:HAMP domain-containing protein
MSISAASAWRPSLTQSRRRANVIDRLRRGDYPGSVRYALHIVDGLAIDETDELIEAAEQMAREVGGRC